MATATVKAGLDAIADRIAELTATAERLHVDLTQLEANLTGIQTDNTDLITEVQGYPGDAPDYVGASPFEAAAQDELNRMTADFLALKTKVTAAKAALT